LVERPKPQPVVDPEAEARWKLSEEGRQKAEEARHKAEEALALLKQEMAKKPAQPAAPKPPPKPKIATIYRGLRNVERVLLDHSGVTHLEPPEPGATPETVAIRRQVPFGSGLLGSPDEDDETDP
jgi:hypothetical protein